MKKLTHYFLAMGLVLFSTMLMDLSAQIVPVGSGSYTTTFPGGSRNGYPDGTPYVSGPAATQPIPTNDWWSDMIKSAHGGQAYNYPLSFRSEPKGLVVNYTIPPNATANDYRQPISDVDGVTVGVSGLNAPLSTVEDHTDWGVTLNWSNSFFSTMTIGSPFVYFEKSGGNAATIDVGFNPYSSYVQGNKIIIENNFGGATYIVFGPQGSSWTGSGGAYTSTLNGKNYWSMVMIPAGESIANAIAQLEPYAYVFPGNTQVSWDYNESNSKVTSTFTVTPDVKEGLNNVVLQGLLPHQWDHLAPGSPQPSGYVYESVRGDLKMLSSNTFTVEHTFKGILPTMPDLGKYTDGYNPADLASSIEQMKNEQLPAYTDSYNEGQGMNKLIQAARIADQLGNIEARDMLISTVQTRLEDWLSAESGEEDFIFYYNDTYTALLGYPSGHGQSTNINDHHFHWGYFIHAAAAIEQFKPGWATQWGDMIYMLIRDAANPSRTDSMFPFLRNFSPYAGHCWANGFAEHPHGNDQESTSESMQFNSALIHWGSVTGNDAIRDLGIFLYTTELTAIQEYWFDVEERSFQPAYDYEMVARVWTGGYDNGTWWTNDVAASYGIQLYPIHAGSLYLGHRTDYIQRVWTEMTQNTDVLNNTPNNNLWYDTYWKFLSFLDADEALNLYRGYRERDIKVGISDAQTYHWLHSMASMGQVAIDITANYPIAAAFRDDAGNKTYAAHNYSNSSITVSFSDGYSLSVPANSMATNRDTDIEISLSSNLFEVPVGGNVNLSASVTGSGVTSVSFYRDGTLIGSDNSAPFSINSGALPAGYANLYAKANVESNAEFSNVVSVQVGEQLAYGGSPTSLPGTIEAGHYDTFEGGNGQGVSYSDNESYNQGDFRPDEGVDASITTGEGATVGWIGTGEWLEYTVNVSQAGQYDLTLRYASGDASGGGPFWLERNGVQISPSISVPTTGDWGNFQDHLVENVSLAAGQQIIRLAFNGAGFNLGRMTFEYTGVNQPVLTTINVTPSNASINEGATQQFSAQAFDQNGDPMNVTFNWSATGGSINSNGLFTGSSNGNFTITASSVGVQGTASITVSPVSSGVAIPGIVEVEDYTDYYDTSTGNDGGAYRDDDVDIEATGDATGAYNIGWTEAGEWLEYNINATASSDLYDISARLASPSGGGQLHIEIDGLDVTGPITPQNTGGWQTYATVTVEDVAISSGNHVMRIAIDAGGFNINYVEAVESTVQQPVLTSIVVSPNNPSVDEGQTQQFSAQGYDQNGQPIGASFSWSATGGSINENGLFTSSSAGNFTVTATSGSISGNASIAVNAVSTGSILPGRIEAENYNAGGQNVGYYDTSAGNTGGAFRTSEDVDIEAASDAEGTFNVGWTEAGEWLEYDINATASNFDISVRAASDNGAGSMRIEIDGQDVTGSIAVPNNGGWQSYQTITVENIAIAAGSHTMRIYFISAGINLNYVDFTENTTTTPAGCTQTGPNGDYTVSISADNSNPFLTFEPGYTGVGNPTTILYYGTSSSGPYPGYNVSPNTPFQLNASNGQTVYFYYTYSVPEGGERNSAGSPHSFTVGNCGSGARIANEATAFTQFEVSVFPNPVQRKIHLNLGESSFQQLEVIDMTGRKVSDKVIESNKVDLDITNLQSGHYLIRLSGQDGTITKRFIKQD